MRRVKHALRWIGLGALLAYLFDPDRGRERREAALERGKQLVEQAKGVAHQVEDAATEARDTMTAPRSDEAIPTASPSYDDVAATG